MEVGAEAERCPYCMSPIEQKPLSRRLTVTQWAVYKTVVDAGPGGASIQDLMDKHLPGRNIGTLRTLVYAINQIINPQCLRGKGGRYYLDRVKWSEEKTE